MPLPISTLRNEAAARRVARAQRTAVQQLAILGKRPGEAKRERARLMAKPAKG